LVVVVVVVAASIATTVGSTHTIHELTCSVGKKKKKNKD
jgi:hypothetical protein